MKRLVAVLLFLAFATPAFATAIDAAGPAPMSNFAPGADATAARDTFNGTLAFSGRMTGFRLRTDSFNSGRAPSLRLRQLPSMRIALTQRGDRLIPLVRGPVSTGHPYWDYAVGVGRVWSEPSDNRMTRAALPFALIETNANCTHNGVLSFSFDNAGAISDVTWQIASETCTYLQFDAWGVSAARYTRGGVDGASAIARDAVEFAGLMPTRPLSQLARDFPGVDLSAFASPADVNPAALSTFGVVYGGVHYLGGCDTRAGPYPFCEELLLPSYSLAKSLAAGLGLMRLEMLRPGAMNEPIADHVPSCTHWGSVTFGDALDMSTGRYASSDDQADETTLTSGRFFLSTTHREKARLACSIYPRRQAPGAEWVYHTSDTYVLGAAMTDTWRDANGGDFFNDVLRDGVYAPLHLSPEIGATRRTSDGQPFFGWGLTLTRDDVAKLGAYLTAPNHDTPLVDPAQLNAAMQRDPSDPGLRAGDDTLRYNNGFWAYNAQGPLHCATPVWIPFLSGFGGNIVALMPTGVTYYYFSDGNDFRWARAVVAANAIAPLCPRGAP